MIAFTSKMKNVAKHDTWTTCAKTVLSWNWWVAHILSLINWLHFPFVPTVDKCDQEFIILSNLLYVSLSYTRKSTYGLKVRKCFLKNEIELILEKKVKHCNPLWPTRSSSDIACFKTLCIQLDTELLSRYLFILDIRYFMVSPDIGYWKFPRYLLLLGVKYFLILYFYTILLLLYPTCS